MSRRDDLRLVGELVARSSFSLSATDDAIVLRRGPSIGLTATRIVITVLLLPFVSIPILLLLEPDVPFNIPAAAFYLVWYGTLGGFAAFMGEILFRWQTVRVDAARGRLELHGKGRLLWFPRRVCVPLETVRELELRLGPRELQPTAFTWTYVHAPRGEAPRKLRIGATVEGIDRREEALHLTARIARMLGWTAMEVTHSGELGGRVRFAPSGAVLDDPRPIPPLEEIPDYGQASAAEVPSPKG